MYPVCLGKQYSLWRSTEKRTTTKKNNDTAYLTPSPLPLHTLCTQSFVYSSPPTQAKQYILPLFSFTPVYFPHPYPSLSYHGSCRTHLHSCIIKKSLYPLQLHPCLPSELPFVPVNCITFPTCILAYNTFKSTLLTCTLSTLLATLPPPPFCFYSDRHRTSF